MITETKEDRLIREIKFRIGDSFKVYLHMDRTKNNLNIDIRHSVTKVTCKMIRSNMYSIEKSLELCLSGIKDCESEEITFENYFNKHFLNK